MICFTLFRIDQQGEANMASPWLGAWSGDGVCVR